MQRQNHLEGYEVCILANHVPLLSKKNASSLSIQFILERASCVELLKHFLFSISS
jgi:hypothetical protein